MKTLGLVLAFLAEAAGADLNYRFHPRTFVGTKGEIPACTPLAAEVDRKRVTLRDPNGVWLVRVPAPEYQPGLEGFNACVVLVLSYEGRYRPEHLTALARGELAAGMPVEFALMVLGPPTQRPALMSLANPVTGQVETTTTYLWMRGYRNGLTTAFSLVGTLALGMAGAAGNLETANRALGVANAAGAVQIVSWQVAELGQARFITVQANQARQITLLMAQ